jgi:hypothetical protein
MTASINRTPVGWGSCIDAASFSASAFGADAAVSAGAGLASAWGWAAGFEVSGVSAGVSDAFAWGSGWVWGVF